MKRFLVAMTLAVLEFSTRADDSPQFRGQGGLGISEKPLPVRWSAKENILWNAALPGRGLSCPVIASGRVFVTACSGANQDRLHVLCFDARTGKQLWHRQLWATGNTLCHEKTCTAAPTPVTDGKRVIALFATADLVCYDRDGNLEWYRSLTGDYQTIGNNVGMAASPILHGDLFLLCLENAGASFAAGIDKYTGKNKWKIERPRGINWVTPLLIQDAGKDLVLFQGPEELSAHDPATGKKQWSLTDQKLAAIPSPIAGDGLVYLAGEKFLAIRPSTDKGSPEVVWKSNKLSGSYSSPLFYKGLVYMLTAGGVLNCADGSNGKHLWSQRVQGTFAASPLAADGKIYLVSEDGNTTIVQAGTEPKIITTNALSGTFLATPAAADGALYLRSDKHLYCIGDNRK